ncbi:hypothetical protein [Paenibacillus sp. 23TSA30-6]|uniref:hypothetical protein n=1 Tax=Paenibacillus sp. 23TSA30-6 TaxID=2546104 RepID=UPI001EE31E1A|nr:hypothetical protein [Paenibacillus sp. 23TSA30-6]
MNRGTNDTIYGKRKGVVDIDQDDFVVEKVIKISCGRLVKGMMLGIVLILILGGCQKVNTDEDAELISKAKATAVKHMKDKYGLDVEITYEHKLPTYVDDVVTFKGNVIGHKEQTFGIMIDYNNQEISNVVIEPELEKGLLKKGHKLSYIS